MRTGKVLVYNQMVDHRVLASSLRKHREYLVCVLNKNVSKFQFAKFMNGEYVRPYETFITKQNEFLIITLLDKKSKMIENRFVIKSREPGYEFEFALPELDYYSTRQRIVNKKYNVLL